LENGSCFYWTDGHFCDRLTLLSLKITRDVETLDNDETLDDSTTETAFGKYILAERERPAEEDL
jgi:hypothetical protein